MKPVAPYLEVSGQLEAGMEVEGREIKGQRFSNVSFDGYWLNDCDFKDCQFVNCQIVGLTIMDALSFNACVFENCEFDIAGDLDDDGHVPEMFFSGCEFDGLSVIRECDGVGAVTVAHSYAEYEKDAVVRFSSCSCFTISVLHCDELCVEVENASELKFKLLHSFVHSVKFKTCDMAALEISGSTITGPLCFDRCSMPFSDPACGKLGCVVTHSVIGHLTYKACTSREAAVKSEAGKEAWWTSLHRCDIAKATFSKIDLTETIAVVLMNSSIYNGMEANDCACVQRLVGVGLGSEIGDVKDDDWDGDEDWGDDEDDGEDETGDE